MRLAVVSTLYMSGPYIEEFHRRISQAAAKLTDDYQIIFVDDGSPDDSRQKAAALCKADPKVVLIELSRNFGHHKAMMTGLEYADGDLVLLIDSDLEEEPELLLTFHELLEKNQMDVVYGVQRARKGGMFERVTGNIFYSFINSVSPHPVPRNLVTARLMRRAYVQALVAHRDQALFLAGVWAATGFRQMAAPVTKLSHSPTTYNLVKRVRNLVEAVTSFSTTPLSLIFYLGCLISLTAAVYGGYLVARRVLFGELMEGWASLIISIWFLGGLTLFCLGVIGIYLSKVFVETKRRPYTVIREIYGATAGALKEIQRRP
ncbi:MAG TPA: glycosyltransferase family 2 protein [Polyangia bacterium]|nr:glycosyltransferase family 2 protein [Polyangia bacterium]